MHTTKQADNYWVLVLV